VGCDSYGDPGPAALRAIPTRRSSDLPYGRGRGNRVREETATYAYEDEDQSAVSALRLGMRVRHPQFGVGTITSVEVLDDDTKLRSEEHTSELQSRFDLVCRLLLEKKK